MLVGRKQQKADRKKLLVNEAWPTDNGYLNIKTCRGCSMYNSELNIKPSCGCSIIFLQPNHKSLTNSWPKIGQPYLFLSSKVA